MSFLVALLSLIVAGDVVELEPVSDSPANTFGCDKWSAAVNVTNCTNSPYCRWYGSGSTFKCYDDPCLKLMTAGQTCGTISISGSGVTDVVACAPVSNLAAKWTNADCGDDQEVVSLCAQTGPLKNPDFYDYCLYAKLRDGTCPDSVCREYDPNALDSTLSGHCILNAASSPTGCNILSTATECGLVPKCYWKSGNSVGNKCIEDPCFIKEDDIVGGGVCANYHPGGDSSITCTEFKPFKKNGGGSVATYCVISANKEPNLCYFGTPGTDDGSSNDYGKTYPTLNITWSNGVVLGRPSCVTTATTCDNMGNCTLVVNKKGGLAGAYCTDGTHGAASVLRIPSLFVVLLIVLLSIFNL